MKDTERGNTSSHSSKDSSSKPKLPHRARSRRQLMKSLVAGGGVAVTGNLLPESWHKPLVRHTILPAHATSTLPACCQGPSDLGCQAANVREEGSLIEAGPFGEGITHTVGVFTSDADDLNLELSATLDPNQVACGPISVSFAGNLQDDTDDGQGGSTVIQSGETIGLGFDAGEVGGLFNDFSENLQITLSHPCAEDCVISFVFTRATGD